MTIRSCFYPLWGKQIEGWRGDVVDILSIMCTLFGVCTSLGLGVRQLNRGLIRLDRGTFMGVDYYGSEYTSSDPMRKTACGNSSPCRDGKMGWDFNVKTQCWIVAFVTLLATCSVAVGLKRGIEKAVAAVTESLLSSAKEIDTKEQIAATAGISAGDPSIGELIAEAMDKVGKEGVITVEESQTFGLIVLIYA